MAPVESKNGFYRHAIADAEQRLQEGLFKIVSQAGHFPGRGHLHTQSGIRSLQPRKGKLRGFNADVVELEQRMFRFGSFGMHHYPGSGVDEVVAQDFRDERKAPRGAQVALDDLDLVILGNELNVERAVDVQGIGNLPADEPHLADGLQVGALRRHYQGGVSRVHPGVLDVL